MFSYVLVGMLPFGRIKNKPLYLIPTYFIIRKAIIPVAGLGTRFLPATKAMPKENVADLR
jgi:hypothetical protein